MLLSFTSLSKVHLKVEYRDWHAAVLFGAISNMLASLKKKKTCYRPLSNTFESPVQPLLVLRILHFTGCVKEKKKTFTKASVYFHFIYKTISVFFGK